MMEAEERIQWILHSVYFPYRYSILKNRAEGKYKKARPRKS